MFDRDGNLWVGTYGKGTFSYSRKHGGPLTDELKACPAILVYALFEDREGIVWAGTPAGIDSFRDPPVASFSSVEGLGKDLPAGVLASRDGTIWVANAGSLDHIEKNGTVSSIRTGEWSSG